MQVQRGLGNYCTLLDFLISLKLIKSINLLRIAMINNTLLLKLKKLTKIFKTFSFINPFLAERTERGHFLYKHKCLMRTLIKQGGGTELEYPLNRIKSVHLIPKFSERSNHRFDFF